MSSLASSLASASVIAPSGTASVATSALARPSQGTTNSSTPDIQGPSGLSVRSQTPIFACEPASYNYTGGSPPYLLYIINSGVNYAPVLKTLPAAATPGTGSWGVDIPPGTSITFAILDNMNRTEYSAPLVIQTNDDLSCLPGQAKSSNNTGAIAGGVVGGVLGAALIGLLAWFFIVRPARRARSKSEDADFYSEPKNGSKDDGTATPVAATVSRRSATTTIPLSSPGVGSYNLGGLDFNEDSLTALEEVRQAPPAYEGRPARRPPISASESYEASTRH